MRLGGLVVVASSCLACSSHAPVTHAAALGETFTLAPYDQATVGHLSLVEEPTRQPSALDRLLDRWPAKADAVVALREGAEYDTRSVLAQARKVKFTGYVIELGAAAKDHRVSLRVTAWQPASPLAPGEAKLVAEERLSPGCPSTVVCDDGVPSLDGKTLQVRCTFSGESDSERNVSVDAKSGAVLSVVQIGGA